MKKDTDTTNPAMLEAMAAALGYIPSAHDHARYERMIHQHNKSRCVECLCKIPPGKAGRKCKACRA